MSQNSRDESDESDWGGTDQPWNYTGPDGREHPWRDEPYLYDHLPDPTPPPETQPPTKYGFTSIYSENPMDRIRADTFYERPYPGKRGAHVVLTFQAKASPNEKTRTGEERDTAMLSVRLMFPTDSADRKAVKWGDIKRRDEAAKWIDDNLGKLYSQGSLSGCVAGGGFRTHGTLMEGDGNTLRLSLGSLLQDLSLKSISAGLQDPAIDPSSSAPSDKGARTRLYMDLPGGKHVLDIREAAKGTDIDKWEEGQCFDDLQTQLKPKGSNGRVTLENRDYEGLKKRIQKSNQKKSYHTDQARCVFGNVVLCGPRREMPDTLGSTNTIAES